MCTLVKLYVCMLMHFFALKGHLCARNTIACVDKLIRILRLIPHFAIVDRILLCLAV